MQLANAINDIDGAPTSEYAYELAKRWTNVELTGEQIEAPLTALEMQEFQPCILKSQQFLTETEQQPSMARRM